jgi:Protein of unknown function (DUF3891)
MIVRHADSQLLCISQPDHAALAGTLGEAWAADGVPTRPTRPRLMEAIRRHDIGWTSEDEAPRFDAATHGPHAFVTAPVEVRQEVFLRGVETLAPEDAYVAALVAQHGLTVYRRYQHDPGWRAFFPALEARRDDLCATLLDRAAPAPMAFLQDYSVLGLCDLFSLVFCNGWREPHLMEGYEAVLERDRLVVTPDPFGGAAVDLTVPARALPLRPYWSQEDLDAAWAEAPTIAISGRAVGARRAS